MAKKIISAVLICAMLVGCASFAAGAVSEDGISSVGLQTARNVAVFYLATLEPSEDGRTPGEDFSLSTAGMLFDLKGEAFYCFAFDGDDDGYIVVSLRSDLPIVMECAFGECPFVGNEIAKAYYISPVTYALRLTDGSLVDANGQALSEAELEALFADYTDYRSELKKSDVAFLDEVSAENAQLVSAARRAKLNGWGEIDSWDKLLEIISDYTDYYLGAIMHSTDNVNAAVEELIRQGAGEAYTVTEVSLVDKSAAIPRRQNYYEEDVGNGVCGKASFMMALSYYRDGRGFDNLPDDATMYAEISAIYDEIDEYYSFFFGSEFISQKIGLGNSYLMLGTLDMGIAAYLFSKGYKDAAQNVVDNMRFSVVLIPDGVSNALLTALRGILSNWLSARTNGELNLMTGKYYNAEKVVLDSLKKQEPVVIGCLTAIGYSRFSNHYFLGVGYYKLERPLTVGGVKLFNLKKEYVEVYDTWGSHSSVMIWSVFRSTALYSVNSLADLG